MLDVHLAVSTKVLHMASGDPNHVAHASGFRRARNELRVFHLAALRTANALLHFFLVERKTNFLGMCAHCDRMAAAIRHVVGRFRASVVGMIRFNAGTHELPDNLSKV